MSQDQTEEGGTKIKKRVQLPPPPPSPPPPQVMCEPEIIDYQEPPIYVNPPLRNQMINEPRHNQKMYNNGPNPTQKMYAEYEEPDIPSLRFFSNDHSKLKQTILVVVIFVLLNSKLVWSQLLKLPFMGSVEPSIIALIINSILAGLAFYLLTNLIK
jgi:hypothetical protein